MNRSTSILVLALLTACSRPEPAKQPEEPERPQPVTVTVAQFARLRWLEGRWRGTLDDTMPFYESYRFINDSSIQVHALDSTGAKGDSGTVRLRRGHVFSGDGNVLWGASAFDSTSIRFDPIQNARNAFVWRRQGNGWTATLSWRDTTGAERTRVYQMRPWRP